MFRVPKGTRVVLMRHAESNWNRERLEALNRGSLPPVRLPSKRDAELSPYGRVQAYLAGCFLRKNFASNGEPVPFDLAVWSSYRRAQETYDYVVQAMGVVPRFRSQTIHLDEAREWLSDHYHSDSSISAMREQASPFLSTAINGENAIQRLTVEMLSSFTDVIQHEMRQESKLLGSADFTKPTIEDMRRVASRASKVFDEAYVPVFLAWYVKQMNLPPQERRKTPEWERYEDIKDRASVIAKDLHSYLWDEGTGARTALVVTHSKIAIALRELFEELPDEQVEKILTSEGPPFPPNVGMTFYHEVDGLLVLDGTPCRLPAELVVEGRHSLVAEGVSERRIQSVCNAVGVRKELDGYKYKISSVQRLKRQSQQNALLVQSPAVKGELLLVPSTIPPSSVRPSTPPQRRKRS